MAPLGSLAPNFAAPRITRRTATLAVAGAIAGVGALAITDGKAFAVETERVAADPVTADAPLLDQGVYSSLSTEQQAAVDRLRSRFGDDVLVGVQPPAADGEENARAIQAANPAASWFAQEVLSWGAGFGLEAGYGALASAMGWSGGGSPMAEVNTALQEISAQYTEILGQLQSLSDEVVWNSFASAHFESEEEATEILEAARDIAAFESLGAAPSKNDVSVIATATRDAMTDLGPTLLTSRDAGSVPALVALETHANPVSDTEDQWERILAGIDAYRSAYAQGIMSMLWAAQFDEQHGTNWGTFAVSRVEAANETIEQIYDYVGAPYPQRPGGERWVHENGAEWALASSERPGYLAEAPKLLTEEGDAGHRMALLASSYRAVDGATLDGYLDDRGIATRVPLTDTYRWHCTGGSSTKSWQLARWHAQLKGNAYTTEHEYYRSGEKRNAPHCSALGPSYLQPMVDSDVAAAKANPVLAEVAVPINPKTGLPALMDQESIRAQRDGLEDLRVTRGNGDLVSVAFTNSGYDSLQVVSFDTDDVLGSFDLRNLPNTGSLGTFDAPNGAVELRVGYSVDGDRGLQDTRATSVVATNPGESSISLERGKPYVAAAGAAWEIAPASSKHVKTSGKRDHLRLYTHTPIELRASREEPNVFSLEKSFHTGDYPWQPPNLVTAVQVDDLSIEIDPHTGKISGAASGTAVDMNLNPIEPAFTASVAGQVDTDFDGGSRSMRLVTTLDAPYQGLSATDLIFRPPPT